MYIHHSNVILSSQISLGAPSPAYLAPASLSIAALLWLSSCSAPAGPETKKQLYFGSKRLKERQVTVSWDLGPGNQPSSWEDGEILPTSDGATDDLRSSNRNRNCRWDSICGINQSHRKPKPVDLDGSEGARWRCAQEILTCGNCNSSKSV